MTDDFRQAAEYAQWWTRKALDIARGETDLHPGVLSHLTGADVQHWAVEQLMSTEARAA